MTPETLITGATGFLGASLARALLLRGESLRLLMRPESNRVNLLGLVKHGAELCEGSIEDEGVLRQALSGVRRVYHCAAKLSFRKQDRREIWRSNHQGTAGLAKLAREAGVERLLHVSSLVAVGACKAGAPPLTEESPYNLASLRIPYCESKHAAEQAVLMEHARGLDVVIVNPSLIIGPGDLRGPGDSILLAIAEGKAPFLPPGGINVVDVRDVVAGSIAAMESGRSGERYLLGGQNLSHVELARITLRILGRQQRLRRLAPALYSPLARIAGLAESFGLVRQPLTGALLRLAAKHIYCDCSKAEKELGYAAYPIEMAIKASFDQWLDRDQVSPCIVAGLGRL
ncbi:MAG: NAD-dependent dehydratase [Planctomycetota bacterium]|nr:MAG: NAD-dependent dehydratase [Planctomycetota bacterium]